MNKSDVDVIIGSKRHPLSKINYPFTRKITSLIYNLLTRSIFNLNIGDTQTGLKLFKYDVLRDVLPIVLCKKFAFDLELLVNVAHKKYKIIEVPIEIDWQRTENRIKLKEIWLMTLDTLAIFYRLKILKYYTNQYYYLTKNINLFIKLNTIIINKIFP